MLNIDHRSLPEELRSAILKKALLAESTIYHAGVSHYDFCPRNIILLGFDPEGPSMRVAEHVQVKVIDFNTAEVHTHPRHAYRKWYKKGSTLEMNLRPRIHSPIVRFHGQMMEFYGWVSAADYEAERWLWRRFHDDDRLRPVIWDPDHPEERPEYADESDSDHGSLDSGISMGTDEDKAEFEKSRGQSNFTL